MLPTSDLPLPLPRRAPAGRFPRRAPVLAASLAAALAAGCGDAEHGVDPAPTGAPAPGILSLPAGWTVMEPGGDTVCSRGTPFSYFVRPGTVNKVVVEFRGGGACWNALTCGLGDSLFQETVSPDPWVLNESLATGIYDHANPLNPFKDWHHVYIPYCTGDIHWGDNDATYGSGANQYEIHHRGAVNVRAALGWVYENLPDPEKVFVTGCSAGAYGAIMWSAHLRQHYEKAKVYQLADSGAGVITDTFFQDSYPSWNPGGSYPTWIPGVDPVTTDRLPRLYAAIGGFYPEMTLSQYNTAYDEDQTFFFQAMGGGDAYAWSTAMRASTAEIVATTPSFRYYLAPDDLHCIIPLDEFYAVQSDGKRLVDWVRDMVEDRPIENIACEGDACGGPTQPEQ